VITCSLDNKLNKLAAQNVKANIEKTYLRDASLMSGRDYS
jgi:hypothetical protein